MSHQHVNGHDLSTVQQNGGMPDRPAVEVHTSQHVAELHRELWTIVRAASFAVTKLGSNPSKADVQQAASVLRHALEEISK